MQTRREQVRAYRFVTRRIVSALLSAEPETTDLPMRRLGLAVFSSAMLAAVVFAGVGVYGLINPGGGRPESDTLVIERETGARYVYRDGALYPVVNYTSARLILGTPEPVVRLMSQRSLRGVPRRRPVGIEGAPDALPERKALVGLPWSVCSAPRSADVSARRTSLLIGTEPQATESLGDTALFVSDAEDHSKYLIWHDQRMAITKGSVQVALGLPAEPIPVGPALLNAITAGPDLEPVEIPGEGDPSGNQVDGEDVPIGRVFRAGDQYYVMLSEGLAPIGEVTELLLERRNGDDREITPDQAGKLLTNTRVEPKGFPTAIPESWEPRTTTANGVSVCASYRGGDGPDAGPRVGVLERTPEQLEEAGSESGGRISGGVRSVDRVVVAGGKGALARSVPAPGASADGTPLYLVTDQGVKYPLATANADVQAMLGYGEAKPTLVPSTLLALIPTGPALDPVVASGPAQATNPTPDSAPTRSPSPSPSPSPRRRATGSTPAKPKTSAPAKPRTSTTKAATSPAAG